MKLRSGGNGESAFRLGLIWLALFALASCSPSDSVIVVGSKNFTESVLLGELLAQQIEHRTDLRVDRRLNLGGTFLCHQALRSGQIDVYPEYTGTALTAILKRPVEQDPDKVFETVSGAYRQEFAAQWLKPFGFNNTFAVVVRPEERLQTISDLAAVSKDRIIGFNFEFLERQDGYTGLIARYGLSFAAEPKTMDLGLLYRALRGGTDRRSRRKLDRWADCSLESARPRRRPALLPALRRGAGGAGRDSTAASAVERCSRGSGRAALGTGDAAAQSRNRWAAPRGGSGCSGATDRQGPVEPERKATAMLTRSSHHVAGKAGQSRWRPKMVESRLR